MSVCRHTLRPEVNGRQAPQLLSTLRFETGFLTEPSVHQLTKLAGQQALGILQSYRPCARVTDMWYHTWLLHMGPGDLTSGPHPCVADILLTESPPQPRHFINDFPCPSLISPFPRIL